MLPKIAKAFSDRARKRRAAMVLDYFKPSPNWKILDLGGGTGAHFQKLFPHFTNVVICDHAEGDLYLARQRGYATVQADGTATLPFKDKEFDLVFCSSVIEHVTGDKQDVVVMRNSQQFRQTALAHQKQFAEEIRRIARRFYVQTPHKYFLIESHSWLPLPIVWLHRAWQIDVIAFFNKFWPKKTQPDWHLLVTRDMKQLFPDAHIAIERFMNMPKSIMAFGGEK